MKSLMKAAIAHTFNAPLVIEEVPIPTVSPKQILVKIEASGVCHTDLHAVSGDWPVKPTLPIIPGHEGAGVVAIGAEVKSVKEVDRVGVPWLHTACSQCEFCLTGWERYAYHKKIQVIPLTAAMLNMCWQTPITWGTYLIN